MVHHSFHAEPVGDVAVPPLTIAFDLPLPKLPTEGYVEFARGLYDHEARSIVAALKATLPGGLFDALVVALLDEKRSILSVPIGG